MVEWSENAWMLDVIAGVRRSDAHLSSTDGEDDWQAIDNVSFTVTYIK